MVDAEVEVSRQAVTKGLTLNITWSITFINVPSDASIKIDYNGLQGATLTLRQTQLSNALAGTFSLKYGGLTSTTLPWDASANTLRDALLPIVRDISTGIYIYPTR